MKLTDFQTFGQSNCRTLVLSNFKTIRLLNYRTIELSIRRNVGLSNCLAVKLLNLSDHQKPICSLKNLGLFSINKTQTDMIFIARKKLRKVFSNYDISKRISPDEIKTRHVHRLE